MGGRGRGNTRLLPTSRATTVLLWLRDDADAIETVARSQRVQFAGGVAEAGHIPFDGIPVGRVQIGIELDAVGSV